MKETHMEIVRVTTNNHTHPPHLDPSPENEVRYKLDLPVFRIAETHAIRFVYNVNGSIPD